mmetsp:Transcript_19607/g.54628  ORF Transcript_19607/g.54628 Transcript_19607/m.54628 type:complete len:351 (-) Transcript_19607:613-1665(-)|eukprot:CAMPEP_0202384400 /NCGR_PEP_ID=MMETSP1127-20130417/55088_1 /ASSEMBLY_ACC=CAM_ASM_000462 /TAXON_ID=3047 /ORGANISM="Dunaliella tertiolecta, Strain CCMP1320" /LENGTH=350 /DNA_ID=CAMNT_0048984213 /DNA_START=74 /DNA_END=1126 /DNA_ORIENTATION=+
MPWIIPPMPNGSLAPSGRGGHCMSSVGSRLIVFGGSDRVPLSYDDLWVLDTAEEHMQWTRISPLSAPGCQILPRSGATLTAIGDLLYLYGGQEPLTEFRFGDIKVLDTRTWTWSNVEVQGQVPPPRHSHAAGVLAGQCLLVYGGSGYSDTLSDVWVFNAQQRSWRQALVTGTSPPGREMHSATMVGPTTMLVFGGRAGDGRVLSDAALLEAADMRWSLIEPTPFSRCAHTGVAVPSSTAPSTSSSIQGEQQQQGPASSMDVLIYGGFSGDAVEGDVIKIDGKTLDVELLQRSPREADKIAGTVPPARFAHGAAPVQYRSPQGHQSLAMAIFGGVTPAEDMQDVAFWVVSN